MKQAFKTVLSVALTILLICSAVPAAFGDDTVASGTCGASVRWDLIQSGLLTIRGSGPMSDFSSDETLPWDVSLVQYLLVTPGVTSVGANAFRGCEKLHSVSLAESVTSIGVGAFADCSACVYFLVPGAVEALRADAFPSTDHRWSLLYGGSETDFAERADAQLRSALNPADLFFNVPAHAHADLGEIWYVVHEPDCEHREEYLRTILCRTCGSGSVVAEKNIINDKGGNGHVVPYVLRTMRAPTSEAPYGVLHESAVCTACGKTLLDRNISLERPIPGEHSADCGYIDVDGINQLYPGEAIDLMLKAKGDLPYWTLTDDGVLTFSGSGVIPDAVCHGADKEDLELPRPFYWGPEISIPHIQRLILEEGITGIGASDFSFLFFLTSVSFPSTLESIGDYAFYYCPQMASITFPASLKQIGDAAFGCCFPSAEGVDLEIPSSVETVGNSAFEGCFRIRTLQLHEGLKKIGSGAFAATFAPDSITIPASCTELGEDAFSLMSLDEKTIYILNDSLDLSEGIGIDYDVLNVPRAVVDDLLSMENLILLMNVAHYIQANGEDWDAAVQNVEVNPGMFFFNTAIWFGLDLDTWESFSEGLIARINTFLHTDFDTVPSDEAFEAAYAAHMEETFGLSGDISIWDSTGPRTAPWLTICGHGGSTGEAFAAAVGANFVCMHVYGADHFCVYCGEHTPPEWSDWTSDGDETHSRFDTQDPAYTETRPHSFDDGVTTPATCQTPGKTVYTCSVCGAEKQEVSGLLPHAYALRDWTWMETAEGYAVTARFVCENDASHTKDVPAVIKAKTVAPTCTAAGKTVYTATAELDGEVYTESHTEPLEKLPHGSVRGFREETVPATAEKNGSYKKICLDCGAVVASRVLDKTGETPAEPETPAAEERDARICPYCGADHRGLFGMLTYFVHWIAYILQSFVK